MKKGVMKMTELAEMAKLTCLIREETISSFIKDWNLFIDLLLNMDKN